MPWSSLTSRLPRENEFGMPEKIWQKYLWAKIFETVAFEMDILLGLPGKHEAWHSTAHRQSGRTLVFTEIAQRGF